MGIVDEISEEYLKEDMTSSLEIDIDIDSESREDEVINHSSYSSIESDEHNKNLNIFYGLENGKKGIDIEK